MDSFLTRNDYKYTPARARDKESGKNRFASLFWQVVNCRQHLAEAAGSSDGFCGAANIETGPCRGIQQEREVISHDHFGTISNAQIQTFYVLGC